MTRSILAGVLGLFGVAAIGVLPVACQSGGVGDPCIPEDEYNAEFAGFKMTEENIESRSFQCSTRICLVNHFQGRVTCPLGQPEPPATAACTPTANAKDPENDKGSCTGTNELCKETTVLADDCTSNAGCPAGLTCDKTAKVCTCTADMGEFRCLPASPSNPKIRVLKSFLCHKKGNCQSATADAKTNNGKDCCVPGTDTPTTQAVCGQCTGASNKKSSRSADQAVYCSCRCGVADGDTPDPDFTYCECPTGFSCEQIRPNIHLGDAQLTGKYCIKEGTKFSGTGDCGKISGTKGNTCEGTL